MKQKLSEEKKYTLIYSGELILFSVVFIALGFLKIFVMNYSETRRIVFNWITLVGALWGITDFMWAILSKKRRARICLLDKILAFPLVPFMVTFDLISLINKPENVNFYIYMIAGALFYVGLIYLIQAVYHYFRPLKSLMDEIEKERQEKAAEEAKLEEQKTEETK